MTKNVVAPGENFFQRSLCKDKAASLSIIKICTKVEAFTGLIGTPYLKVEKLVGVEDLLHNTFQYRTCLIIFELDVFRITRSTSPVSDKKLRMNS